MRVAVKNHALPVYKKNRIASLLCIFESTIMFEINIYNSRGEFNNASAFKRSFYDVRLYTLRIKIGANRALGELSHC